MIGNSASLFAWRHAVIDSFWLQLVIKMLASASIVVVATMAAEKAGPFWGALIASLPVSAGPIYVLLGLEHDAAFIAESAIGSMAATAATSVYMLALALLCPRVPIVVAVPVGLALWFASILGVRQLPWDLVSATALTVGALLIGMAVTLDERRWPPPKAAARGRFDIPLRALLVAGLVALVTTYSRALGPEATGIAAVFPIVMTSLALIIHVRQGGRAVASIMANSFLPMVGFAVALTALHLTATAAGVAAGLAAGLSGSIGWSAVLAAWRLWGPKPLAKREPAATPAQPAMPPPAPRPRPR